VSKKREQPSSFLTVQPYTSISPTNKNKSLTISSGSQIIDGKRNSVVGLKNKGGARKESANNSMVHPKGSLLEQYIKIDKKKAIKDIYVKQGMNEVNQTTLALKSKLFPKFEQF
jgi:hypothetical protein